MKKTWFGKMYIDNCKDDTTAWTNSEGTHKSNGESLDVGVNKCG